MVLRRKILFSMLASFAIIFVLFVSSFGSVSALSSFSTTTMMAGYQAGNGARSVTYIAGSFLQLSFSCCLNEKMKIGIGIDMNPNIPKTTGVQVGVKTMCSSNGICEYVPFFVYSGAVHAFNALNYPSRHYCEENDCSVFMSIQYFSNSNTFVLYFFDQTSDKTIQRVISAGGYNRQSAEWLVQCVGDCIVQPNFENAYSGGMSTAFPQTDYAVISGQYLPLQELPNLVQISGNAGFPEILSGNSFGVLGGG
jgi:hypothetical protein